MTVYAEISGDIGVHAPLVLLHGFGGSGASWDAVRAHLPSDLPVIVYDLPGHRHSVVAEGRGGAGRMAKAILADLGARGVGEFHLSGHSMGGAVASLVAMRAGAAVRSLTLLAPGGMGPDINHRVLSRFAKAISPDDINVAMEPMLGFNFTLSDAVVAAIAAERAAPGLASALQETYEAMFLDPQARVKHQGTLPMEAMAALTCPVTVVWGMQDAILPFHQMESLPPSYSKIRVEEAGHMLLDECPERIAALLAAK
jgi:pimeloyl-ACP methyl ester carboxylesterase